MISNGYFFYKDKQKEENIYWKCDKYHKFKCKARITTQGDEIVKESNEHNHLCDATESEAQKLMENIRKRAKSTTEAPQALISNALVG